MAFGALGRARGMATAANSGAATAGAKPQAEKTSAVVNDAKQGFAASAIDDKVDAKSIPDPAGYEKGQQSEPVKGSTGTQASTANQTAKVTPEAPVAAASPANAAVVSAHLNPLLVAGVPLGAAALLMGIYWLILRAGAV
jgi:hypothetical protein